MKTTALCAGLIVFLRVFALAGCMEGGAGKKIKFGLQVRT